MTARRLQQVRVPVLWNRETVPGIFHLGLAVEDAFDRARPGQFVMVRFSQGVAPLLRRPFSIHRRTDDGGRVTGIELLYKVVGEGTRAMSRLGTGDRVDVLGPLGNGFTVGAGVKRVALAGGGIGVAPLVFLAETLVAEGFDPSAIEAFLGAGTEDDLLCADRFAAMGMSVHLTTDDGSAGLQCLVTHPLEMVLAQSPPDLICACGPMAMLACVAGLAEKFKIDAQVSIEALMACGLGACLGCAVAQSAKGAGFLHACLDGPVFDAQRLDLSGRFLR
ncbi:MAG: dihydroorotate dehydrogenase electron transfer subunit [Desulfobacterales bacterium]|nr:dihydroorotate dehydrogenase electron transfer subunit [Desulfobacterales bacterium]